MTETRSESGLLVERRFNPASAEFKPELRSVAGSDRPHIQGYGSVFGKKSRNLGGFVEQVDTTAFRNSQAQGWPDVIARYNHSDDWLLGTTKAGTCILSIDGTGLYYDVEVPDTTRGNDVAVLCKRGDITSSSFAFRVPDGGDYWERSSSVGGMPMRYLRDIELVDVAPVNIPAYTDATAQLRSYMGAIESLARQFGEDPAEIRELFANNQVVKLFKRSDKLGVKSSEETQPAALRKEAEMTSVVEQTASELDAEGSAAKENRTKLTAKARKALPKSAFAYVDPDGVGHFPIHDANHVRNALARIAQGAKYGKEALAKVKAAAKKFGIDSDEQNTWLDLLEEQRQFPEWFWTAFATEDERIEAEETAARAAEAREAAAKQQERKRQLLSKKYDEHYFDENEG